MNPLIQLRKAIFVFFVALTCFGLPPAAQTQLPSPTPDGFYPGGNTAEAKDALIHVDVQTGQFNTAIGFQALFTNDLPCAFRNGNNATRFETHWKEIAMCKPVKTRAKLSLEL